MADAVWDLQKAMRAESDTKTRSDSDPGRVSLSTTPRALEIAVPGGFRRHHVQQQQPKRVSKAIREQIVDKINSVYDPFIGNMIGQDNDSYDEIGVQERAQSLLQTPVLRLPFRRTPGTYG